MPLVSCRLCMALSSSVICLINMHSSNEKQVFYNSLNYTDNIGLKNERNGDSYDTYKPRSTLKKMYYSVLRKYITLLKCHHDIISPITPQFLSWVTPRSYRLRAGNHGVIYYHVCLALLNSVQDRLVLMK